ncbi:NHLP family bacteriocin export ABC transporter peptidase/permease/ATPase subunit [Longimicrobium sp.]|uniref:NHLP family bacteriocin export ABC transporter peptidase/permease/ATPase subunit n=1 Tax=Longimicrobium sp. TaxID=2029185 RepID=UPI002C14AE25|nr:NHLP family bacteriocin export ABC transporter peptidase/permease/ATPase subunit [Longimicrobium sp.]HSU14672.1 NHLP family bacteriocin export ABC transporter peptidase/permease/ATPase subunit [Longimicrobium sp.]
MSEAAPVALAPAEEPRGFRPRDVLRVLRRPAGPSRVRVPTILQLEAVECGAATLAMVLAAYGRWVPLEEMRVACGVSRDGSKASNMVKAARRYGLDARGFKKEPAQLRELAPPMILHWNFNHFVVLEGFRKGRAHIVDPSTGPRRVTTEELDQAFTGVVLTFGRGEAFARGGALPGVVASLRGRLVGAGPALAFAVLAGIALVVPGLVAPAFSRVFVDQVMVKGLRGWTTPLLAAMVVAGLVMATITWMQQTQLLRLETRLALGSSGRFLWHVLRLPVSFFTQRFAGEIGSRVGVNDRVAQLLSGELATTMLSLLVIAFYAAVMVQYDLVLTGIGVAVAALNVGALRWVSRRRVDISQRLQQDRGKLMGVAMGGLQTIETLKATGSEAFFFTRWAGQQAKVVNAQQQLALYTHLLSVVPPFLLATNTALLVGIGGLRVMDGRLSMGMLVALQALLIAFVTPVNRLVDLGGTLQEVKGGLARLDDVLNATPDPLAGAFAAVQTDGEAEDPPRLEGRLELRGISFGYSPLEPPLIEDFSLALEPGRRVALVGGSGSGKSTIARLVCGLHEPWTGEVVLDGRARAAVPPASVAASLAFVDQDVFLFAGTVRDNLALWDPGVPEADLVRAARDASIHEEITARPGGYHARVEEGGRNFSGGQRQRLEIARALVGNPSLLVLDEATSALDPPTEAAVDDALRRRGCACVIVAHRLSTIRDADEIIVLERGKVVERGTHDELYAAGGVYRALIEAE